MTGPTPRTPLTDVRVLEISDRIAGSYCGKLFRDAGATVVKVEPATGDPLRRYSATRSAIPQGTDGPLFDYLNAGKRSVVGDLGDSVVAALIEGADVVILTAGRADAERAGVAADSRRAFLTISDFGWTGPWADRPATEFTLQGACGATGFRGLPDGPPISVGGDVGEYVGGAMAAFAALAVTRRMRAGGPGEHLDMALLEAMTLSMQSSEWLHTHLLQVGPITRSVEVPSIVAAKDGFVGMTFITGQQWHDFAAMVECPELSEHPEFTFQLGRWGHRDRILELIGPWMREHTVAEIVELGELFRLPMAAIGTGATVTEQDHFVARGVFGPNASGLLAPRPPWRMTGTAPAPMAPAPSVGEAGTGPDWSPRAASTEGAPELPLAGVRVVDLTAFWAGPAATHLLAAFGADVVKIESIQRPDGIRYSGAMRTDVDDWWEYGWVFQAVNTNKRSVTLNLDSPDGVRLFRHLVAGADAVIENFSPRVMEQFGLGADALLEVNPRLVVMRMPAFGLDGPWRDRVGFAPTMEQIAGMAWLTGLPDGPPIPPRGVCDPLAGSHAAFAMVAALDLVARTGTGRLVEMPMIESVLNVTAVQALEAQAFGVVAQREGNRGHGPATQNVYRCAGEDDWVAVAMRDDAERTTMAGLMGASGAELVDDDLAAWFVDRDADDAVEVLVRAGIPAARVISPSDVIRNPHLIDRGYFESLVHPSTGPCVYPRPPFAPIAATDGRWLRTPAPTLGQHTADVLGDLCGVTADELAALAAAGVVGTRPKGL
ncbi:CaiB/BaiF CoA-transferase family protein [Mycolicibacterium arenosum]|uniref:CoA transferase n=1 Tax=Mycolicibacterium arenosum TaxID=2952157 RepID=A0ABT1M1K3_9MYCO|nr:CoA transferase [Mycolicibacterium sp. CAU 1645]MCP9273028.1 CoA transferase [Mycolicibacterium sp. CAU 1645]